MSTSRFQMWYGRDAAPVETYDLRAGPVTVTLVGIDLRHIRIGAVEAVQRIYVAVRDRAWNSIPAAYSDLRLNVADDHFTVDFMARHDYQDLHVSWRGLITGAPDGAISYVMDGVAHADFPYNKMGFNIHHPLHRSAGRPYHAHTPAGPIAGVLPVLIEPQRVENGLLTALFPAFDALSIDMGGGPTVRFAFDGDLFEMQDHRNWTDANYKTYGTPLSIPTPLQAYNGQALRQMVTVSIVDALDTRQAVDDGRGARMWGVPSPDATRTPEVHAEVGRPLGRALPPVGVMMASHDYPLSARETDLLRRLRLDHLRVDLRLADPSCGETLVRAGAEAAALGAALEVALLVRDDSEGDLALAAFASLLPSLPVPLARVLVFVDATERSATAGSTPGSLMRRARAALGDVIPAVPLAGGTNLFFAELNRDRPDVSTMDMAAYAINPQVHACDDTSLVENLAAQADTVRMAQTLCGDRPIAVGPVTFIGRAGPYAAGPPEPGGLPGNVDVRQASLFGAGWTVGSIKYLAESGAAALTYYETTGWLGMVERDAGSPLPDLFPSSAGAVFPLYHVFADLAEWKEGELVELRTADPLAVDGLAVRLGGALHALVANLGGNPRTVTIGPLNAVRAGVRLLDEYSATLAMTGPDRFRASATSHEVHDGVLTLSLLPYAVARIDAVPRQAAQP